MSDLRWISYQWTKALLAYMRSNLWSSLAQASMMAVVLERQHTALCTLARSPPGTTVGGCNQSQVSIQVT